MGYPWREPGEETTDLYPNLVVHDGRVTGSITCGRSRLPLWAFASVAITHGWEEVEGGWEPSDYGFTAKDLAAFVYNLLEARGEFGRLLLALANAERLENLREDAVLDEATGGQGGMVDISPWKEDSVKLPPPWWDDPELSAPVRDALQQCLDALDHPRP